MVKELAGRAGASRSVSSSRSDFVLTRATPLCHQPDRRRDRCADRRTGRLLGEFGAAEKQCVSGRELGEDAVQEAATGEVADSGEDGSGVPTGGRGSRLCAGGQVLDEAPAGEWPAVGDLAGEDPCGLRGEAGGEIDALVAGELTAQRRQDVMCDLLGRSRVG